MASSGSPARLLRPDLVSGLTMLSASLLWSCNWVLVKLIAHDISPFVLAAVRVLLGAGFLFLVLALMRRDLRPTPFVPTFVCGMLQMGFFVLLQNVALLVGGVGKTAILTYTMPLWAVPLAVPLLGERIAPLRLAALGLGLAGLGLVLFPFEVAGALLSSILALTNAVLWGLGVVLTKRYRREHAVDTMSFTAWQLAYSVPPLALTAALVPGAYVHVSLPLIAAVAYIAIASTTIAFVLWMIFLARVSAGTAGIASLLTPALSIGMAALLLGERPSGLEWAGIACIVTGLALNSLPARHPVAAPT